MKKLLFAAMAFAAAAACTAGAQTAAPTPELIAAPQAVDCEIVTEATPNGVRFTAVASADLASTGSYEFVLTKHDRNGASDINQGGQFTMAAESTEVLGEAELSLERRATYHARLVLWDADREICRAERSS